MADFKNYNLPASEKKFMTEEEVRELISASLANWTGITRFRTIETTIVSLTDFTSAQHNHSNAAGGGQFNPNNAFTTPLTVPNGGTGVNTFTSGAILKGAGAGAISTIVPLAGTKIYYVADSSGGAVTRKLTFTDGVLTAEV